MNRKKFLKNGLLGITGLAALPAVMTSCSKDDPIDPNACQTSAAETAGPFPIKSPADLIRENIVGNRTGIPMVMEITIQNVNDNCNSLAGVLVDVWACDAKGNYSEYNGQLDGNFTNENFLRGRQTTDANGVARFVSIYPGWYPGRAPHIHVEVLSASGNSLLVTQIAFPDDISKQVYADARYNGDQDTTNSQDGIFDDSLASNMAKEVTGNNTDGYIMRQTIKVNA